MNGLSYQLSIVIHSQKNRRATQTLMNDLAASLKPVQSGHPDIRDDRVRLASSHRSEQFQPIGNGAQDLELRSQKLSYFLQQFLVIIRQYDPFSVHPSFLFGTSSSTDLCAARGP
ncbi:hypothetical protein SBA3_910027 [Candidatus Sulfopaludibacter sp. SbA3]|nr:hypothetical protein SBA3_910027 [Candidatus Sulfopaludibacter sp. SbA3]